MEKICDMQILFRPAKMALLLTLAIVLLTDIIESVEITAIEVPKAVQWGEEAILDCEYDFKADEKAGLVVKWFKDGHRVPVYQWIPRRKPQALGILRNKVNLNYKVVGSSEEDRDDDEYEKHRAIAIKKATGDIAGTYTCQVSTFSGEDSKSAKLVVYSKPEELDIHINELPNDKINVTCEAEDAFPMPVLQLRVYDSPSDTKPDVHELTERNIKSSEEDDNDAAELQQDVAGFKVFSEKNLKKHTIFECVLTIPAADYTLTQKAEYFPDSGSDSEENDTDENTDEDSSSEENSAIKLQNFTLVLSVFLMILINKL